MQIKFSNMTLNQKYYSNLKKTKYLNINLRHPQQLLNYILYKVMLFYI